MAPGCYRKYIVTLCTTGKAGQRELKRYIEKIWTVGRYRGDPDVVADKGNCRCDNLKHLMTTGWFSALWGTYDPGMFAIPFLPISEVFGARKERVFKIGTRTGKKRQKQR